MDARANEVSPAFFTIHSATGAWIIEIVRVVERTGHQ
jgi:hypothetical protein